jgi:hypothetical protein
MSFTSRATLVALLPLASFGCDASNQICDNGSCFEGPGPILDAGPTDASADIACGPWEAGPFLCIVTPTADAGTCGVLHMVPVECSAPLDEPDGATNYDLGVDPPDLPSSCVVIGPVSASAPSLGAWVWTACCASDCEPDD